MKVLYLTFSFTVGGTERLVSDICNEMVKKNEVHLYVINDLYDRTMFKTLSREVNVYLQKRKVGSRNKINTILEITKYIRENKIDIVHCNAFNTPELLILRSIYFRKTKIVHTIHDVHQYDNLSSVRIKLRNKLVDNFIAISKCVEEDLVAHGVDKEKVSIVYNAINLEKFCLGDVQKKENDIFQIGNVARIVPEKKGQDILIKAIEKVKEKYPNIHCSFAGAPEKFDDSALEKMRELVCNLELEDYVSFMGNVGNIPRFLERLDLFVLPSRFEGFGISVIEAMAMGIPCIVSNLDGPAEIIGKNERGFLFEQDNVEDLAEKICYVVETYDEQKRNAELNIMYVKEHFDIASMCERLIQVYQK